MSEKRKSRHPFRLAAFILLGAAGMYFAVKQALFHPNTPLPRGWNPVLGLRVTDPVSPLTAWKLNRALDSRAACLAALETADTQYQKMPDLEQSENCRIRDRVRLTRVGTAHLAPVETTCAIALRLAMWEAHALRPAATQFLNQPVTQIGHLSSYSCRQIRTPDGNSARMSSHATAEAIDISGFQLGNGRNVTLRDGWRGADDEAAFLRAARDGACRWFKVTLGPDFNELHQDHLHIQSRGWGLCR